MSLERAADLRYKGQSHELTVPLHRALTAAAIRGALAQAHQQRFGHVDPSRTVEVVVARVKARAPGFRVGSTAGLSRDNPSSGGATQAAVVWERPRRTQIRKRAGLGRGGIAGPAVLTQLDTTTLVPPGWRARPDAQGLLILRRTA